MAWAPASSTDALVSTDDFQAWFGVSLDTNGETRAQMAIDMASDAVRTETQQYLSPLSETITIKPKPGDSYLILPQWPVTAIASITWNGQALTDGQDYVWTDRGIVTPLTWVWFSYRDTVSVSYTHGWSPIPRDLAGVCLSFAKRLYDSPNDQIIDSETLGNWSVKYAPMVDGFTPSEHTILSRYRQWTNGY